jgi:hypothetical protein
MLRENRPSDLSLTLSWDKERESLGQSDGEVLLHLCSTRDLSLCSARDLSLSSAPDLHLSLSQERSPRASRAAGEVPLDSIAAQALIEGFTVQLIDELARRAD